MIFRLFVNLSLLVSVIECARILAVIPTPSISHQKPFRPLIHELARRGHQVTLITADPAFQKGNSPKNLIEIDVHDLSYDIWINGLVKHKTGNDNHYDSASNAFRIIKEFLDQQFKTKEIQNVIHGKEEYDLLILEAWVPGLIALTHRFKAPVIRINSMGGIAIVNHNFGVPTHPILYPKLPGTRIYNLTFWEKIKVINQYKWVDNLFAEGDKDQVIVIKKHLGISTASVNELKDKNDMLFANAHPLFERNILRPLSISYLWGKHKVPERELPQDLLDFLDSSKHGVIYMSFGTNIDPANMPPETTQMFIRVFSQLPYDVLWKWSKDELPGKSDNIKIGKWFPQSDLLRHPKIKLFITQGGLQSTDEAIAAGVPLVGLPLLGDQWYNVENCVHFGIGVKLDVKSLTEEQFKKTIETVVNDGSYRRNVAKLRELMKDDPLPPLERAVWWVEYVLRHGGARHLRSPAANMSWIQYYEIQLVSTLLIGLVLVFSVFAYSCYVLYAIISRYIHLKFK